MSEMLFNRIKETAKRQKNMNVKEVGLYLEFGENAIYSWKKSNPSIDKIEKVSDFLNVSTDYLLGRTDEPEILDNSKKQTETDLRKALEGVMSFDGKELSDHDKDAIIAYMMGRMDK